MIISLGLIENIARIRNSTEFTILNSLHGHGHCSWLRRVNTKHKVEGNFNIAIGMYLLIHPEGWVNVREWLHNTLPRVGMFWVIQCIMYNIHPNRSRL